MVYQIYGKNLPKYIFKYLYYIYYYFLLLLKQSVYYNGINNLNMYVVFNRNYRIF